MSTAWVTTTGSRPRAAVPELPQPDGELRGAQSAAGRRRACRRLARLGVHHHLAELRRPVAEAALDLAGGVVRLPEHAIAGEGHRDERQQAVGAAADADVAGVGAGDLADAATD